MNVLIEDLLAASGPVLAGCLNQLPPETRAKVAEACDAGGWCELRVGFMNEAANVLVMLMNHDGEGVLIGRIDHAPH